MKCIVKFSFNTGLRTFNGGMNTVLSKKKKNLLYGVCYMMVQSAV